MNFTPEAVRVQFGALSAPEVSPPPVFLDGPGGAQVPISVPDAMAAYLGRNNANMGGHYFSSHKTEALVRRARESVRALLNAPGPDNIVFGASMTALTFHLSRIISRDWQPGDEIVVTALDHYANVSSWQQAADDRQAIVRQASVNEPECTLDVEQICTLIGPSTRLVAVSLASNTTGSIVDVRRIVEAAHKVGAVVYVDAVHYVPHQLPDVQVLGCDFLVCSAYKFCGPHIGMAYIAPCWLQRLRPYKVEPATDSGPGRFETGTLSFEGLAGVVAAIEYLAQWGAEEASLRQRLQESYACYQRHEQALSEYFLAHLRDINGARLYGIDRADARLRTPTFALTFEGRSPERVARGLGEENICVGNGHFYAQGLIRQLGLSERGGVVRIGLMHYNTRRDIDRLFETLRKVVS
ncbi:cysteine desulfurase-like protein [Erwinia sp. CPCC 100877]|nr:cysteine desulfurase-like protein [Erwinia sp. CPCC 100877]